MSRISSRPLLLTGFEPFEGFAVNSSYAGIEHLAGTRVRGVPIVVRELPVSFRKIAPTLRQILDEIRPRAVVSFGLAPGRAVSIERVALNVAHVNRPSRHFMTDADNDGHRPYLLQLSTTGTDLLWSTLPTEAIERSVRRTLASMRTRIVPWLSNSAGTFLCNAAFYHLMQWASHPRRRVPAGFIHVPPLRTRQESGQARLGSFSLPQLRRVVETVVGTVVRSV